MSEMVRAKLITFDQLTDNKINNNHAIQFWKKKIVKKENLKLKKFWKQSFNKKKIEKECITELMRTEPFCLASIPWKEQGVMSKSAHSHSALIRNRQFQALIVRKECGHFNGVGKKQFLFLSKSFVNYR